MKTPTALPVVSETENHPDHQNVPVISVIGGRSVFGSVNSQQFPFKMQAIKKPVFPVRYYIAVIACLSSAVMYAARANLSVAIISMIDLDPSEDVKKISFEWNQEAQGIILGSYYYGFAGFQIILGYLADRYNVVTLNIITHLIAAVMTLLTPLASFYGPIAISVIRVIIGIAHAPMLSSLYVLFSKWFSPDEISVPICLMIVGSNLGTAAIMPITAWFCKQTLLGGWPLAFYFTGIINLIIPVVWYFTVTPTPCTHKYISEYEKRHLEHANAHVGQIKFKIDWKAVLTSPVLWSITLAKAGTGFGYMIVNTKIPAYLESQLGMDLHENGSLNGLLYIALCTSQLSIGPITKYLMKKKYLSRSTIRKICESIALLVPSVILVAIAHFSLDPSFIKLLLVASMFAFGGNAGGDMPIVSEIAPDISGTIFGITNTIGSATGFIAPMIVGIILNDGDTREGWSAVFYITAGFMSFTAFVFMFLSTSEPQSWGMLPSQPEVAEDPEVFKEESKAAYLKQRRISHPIFSAQISSL